MRHPFRSYVCDSRGGVHVLPQPDWKLGTSGLEPRETELAQLRADLRGVSYALSVRAVGAIALGLLIGVGLYREGMRHLGQADALGALVVSIVAGSGAAFGILQLGARPVDVRSAGARLRSCRLCVCCGYDLQGLQGEADGCTVCPECGAAWDLRAAGSA